MRWREQLSSAAQLARADDVREQLASFLHEERVVDELVASLTLKSLAVTAQ